MERTHTPLSVWFWAAYLVASQTPGMSAAQFQRQIGCRVTKPLFRSCTSSVPVWFDQIRIELVAGLRARRSR